MEAANPTKNPSANWQELVLLIHEAKLGSIIESELETLVLVNGATPAVIDRVVAVLEQANTLDREKLTAIEGYLTAVKPEFDHIATVEHEAKEELEKILIQAEVAN